MWRLLVGFFILQTAVFSIADNDQWGVKRAEQKPLQLYWYQEDDEFLQPVLQDLEQELSHFSWQQLHSMEALQQAIMDDACQEKVLIWQGDLADYQQLRQWAEQGVTIVVLSAESQALSLLQQRELVRLAAYSTWINREQETEQLKKQIQHVLQAVHNASFYRIANFQQQSLSVAGSQAILTQRKPMAGQRWFAEIYAIDDWSDTRNPAFMLQSNGQLLANQAVSERYALSLLNNRSFSIAERGEFGAITQQQWLDDFPTQHQDYAKLQQYFAVEQQALLTALIAFLKGQSLYQQTLPYSLADSPKDASLLLQEEDAFRLFYHTSDGALHQWRFLDKRAYHWHSVYPKQALRYTANLLWGQEKRKRVYSGQISAVQNESQAAAWLFVSSGSAEKAVYAYDISAQLPRLAWHKTTAHLDELAWTHSKLLALPVAFTQQKQQAVLFGAGFDEGYQTAALSQAAMGRAVYLLDVENGEPLWTLTYGDERQAANHTFRHPALVHAMVASVSLNQQRDIAYIGDMGGQVWQISLPSCVGDECLNINYRQQAWSADVIASSQTLSHGFFYSMALWQNEQQAYLLAVSGSAEQHQTEAAQIFFFPVQGYSDLETLPLFEQCAAQTCRQGWRYRLAEGETPLSDPVLWQNHVYVVTRQENTQTCQFVADTYRLYRFKLNAGKASYDVLNITSDSLFLGINKQNIALLAESIEAGLAGLETSVPLGNLLESFDNETTENGIVISSWREFFY